ncbi:hypothetical protein ACQEU3_04650 [Spirillospora sp. CA-253888]
MICAPCRDRRHDECRGGSWCYCQHQSGPATETEQQRRRRSEREGSEREGSGRERAEPGVNWKRQG